MRKYEKPIIQNLGDLIPEAQGNCQSGSQAGLLPPCGGGSNPGYIQHCGPGPVANGACNNGNGAVGTQCVTGPGFKK